MHERVTNSEGWGDGVHEVKDVSLASLVLELNMAVIPALLHTPLGLSLSSIR